MCGVTSFRSMDVFIGMSRMTATDMAKAERATRTSSPPYSSCIDFWDD